MAPVRAPFHKHLFAIRRGWPVHCPAKLLDEVGISDEIAHVDEVEKFREFLDQVQPEDF